MDEQPNSQNPQRYRVLTIKQSAKLNKLYIYTSQKGFSMSFYFTQMLIANNFLFCFLGSHAELDTGMEGNKQRYLSRSFKKAFSKSKIKEKAIQYVTNF